MPQVSICLLSEAGADPGALSILAERWGLVSDEQSIMALVLTPERLELRKRDEPKLGGIYVDFVAGTLAHRRKFGGGRGEAVAKAVGIKKGICRAWLMRRQALGEMLLYWRHWVVMCRCWSVIQWLLHCWMMVCAVVIRMRKLARGYASG